MGDSKWTKERHEAAKNDVGRGEKPTLIEAIDMLAEIERGWAEIERLTAPVDVEAEVGRLLGAMRGVPPSCAADVGDAARPLVIDRARLAREVDGLRAEIESLTRGVTHHMTVAAIHRAEIARLTEQLAERTAERDLFGRLATGVRLTAAPGEAWERLQVVAKNLAAGSQPMTGARHRSMVETEQIEALCTALLAVEPVVGVDAITHDFRPGAQDGMPRLTDVEARESIASAPWQIGPRSKPFPMPGTVWRFLGTEQAPPSGPHTVTSLRWFRDRTEGLFGADSCAGVEHMMGLDAWVCEGVAPRDEVTDAELAEVLMRLADAPPRSWPGSILRRLALAEQAHRAALAMTAERAREDLAQKIRGLSDEQKAELAPVFAEALARRDATPPRALTEAPRAAVAGAFEALVTWLRAGEYIGDEDDPIWVHIREVRHAIGALALTEAEAQRIAEAAMQAADTEDDPTATIRKALLRLCGTRPAPPTEAEDEARDRLARTLTKVAEWHGERARYGGAAQEWHARCETACAGAAAILAADRGDVPPEVRPTCHGCWTGGEDLHARTEQCSGARPETPEMAVTTGEDAPWTPKPGDRVRTADELTAVGYGPGYCRLPGIAGALTEEHSEGGWWVRHDDGPEAPYDTDELRPAPAGVPSIAGPAGLDAASGPPAGYWDRGVAVERRARASHPLRGGAKESSGPDAPRPKMGSWISTEACDEIYDEAGLCAAGVSQTNSCYWWARRPFGPNAHGTEPDREKAKTNALDVLATWADVSAARGAQ